MTPPRLGFVHIPKTAGTSIRVWLNKIVHSSVHRNAHMLVPTETFAVVRNPWDRIVSLWLQYNSLKKTDIPFDTFVRNLSSYKFHERSWFNFAQPQKEWIPDGVTYLLRFETLEQDFAQIQKIYGCTDSLPKINTSQHDDYHTYYTDETRDIVAQVFKDDIEAFGYSF